MNCTLTHQSGNTTHVSISPILIFLIVLLLMILLRLIIWIKLLRHYQTTAIASIESAARNAITHTHAHSQAHSSITMITSKPSIHLSKLATESAIIHHDICAISQLELAEGTDFLVPNCGHICVFNNQTAMLLICPTCRANVTWQYVSKSDLRTNL